MKLKIKNIIFAFIFAILVTLIDAIFHVLATKPMENFEYFFIKFIMVLILGMLMFSIGKVKAISIVVTIFTVAFLIIFSLYYRLTEFIYSAPFGSRVPDIFSISYYSHPFISTFLWGIVHGLAFAIPSIILWRLRK